MLLRRSGREVLTSYPIPIRFAGFESTTAELQQAGWDLSFREEIYTASCRLALRYEKAGLFGLTNVIDYMGMDLFYALERGNRDLLKSLGFDVVYLGSRLEVHCMPERGASFFQDFSPIDAMPQSIIVERPEDFSLFRKLDKTKDVLIDPNDVPGLMDLVLKAQKPEQDMIRARERTRENLAHWRASQDGRHNPKMDFNPSTHLHAQIISLAG